MKIQFTAKRLIIGCIVFTMGLMTLLCLCIPLLQVNDPMIDAISSSYPDFKFYESGFTLLNFSSNAIDEEMAIVCGLFSLLQLLLSLTTMIFSVVCIFVFDKKIADKIFRGFTIACFVFLVLYMIWGIIFSGALYKYLIIYKDGSWGLFDTAFGGLYQTATSTLAFLGFIFGVLLFAAYIVCTIVLKDDMKLKIFSGTKLGATDKTHEVQDTTATTAKQKSVDVSAARNVAEALKQYKELLDSGIITQDEFNEIRRKILGL